MTHQRAFGSTKFECVNVEVHQEVQASGRTSSVRIRLSASECLVPIAYWAFLGRTDLKLCTQGGCFAINRLDFSSPTALAVRAFPDPGAPG